MNNTQDDYKSVLNQLTGERMAFQSAADLVKVYRAKSLKARKTVRRQRVLIALLAVVAAAGWLYVGFGG